MDRRKKVGLVLLLVLVCFFLIQSQSTGGKKKKLSAIYPGHIDRIQVGVVIDLGSSGNRANVYGWDARHPVQRIPYEGTQFFMDMVNPGITHGNLDPKEAVEPLRKLFDFAVWCVKKAKADIRETPLFVYGTGGLRETDPEYRDEILKEIRLMVEREYSFLLDDGWLGVLDGKDEAAFDWLTIQQSKLILKSRGDPHPFLDALKSPEFNPSEVSTTGVLDMGGSSVEIAFVPSHPSHKEEGGTFTEIQHKLLLNDVYVESYRFFGHNKAVKTYRRIIAQSSAKLKDREDPCCLKGYSYTVDSLKGKTLELKGTGDVQACELIVEAVLEFPTEEECKHSNCGLRGVYQPPVEGVPFVAITEFADLASFLGGKGLITLKKFRELAIAHCEMDWEEAMRQDESELGEGYIRFYCFEDLYIYRMLVVGFGFSPEGNHIAFYESLNHHSELSWSLGVIAKHVESTVPERKPKNQIIE